MARLEMSLTASAYGIGVTPPISTRPSTVGYYQTYDYTYNLQQQVVSGGNAIYDLFNRNVANGWGSTTSGQAYTLSGGAASDYSVNDGTANQGRISNGAAGDLAPRMTLITPAPNGPDIDVRADLSEGLSLPLGAPFYSGLLARADATGANGYYARFVWNPGGVLGLEILKIVAGVETSLALNPNIGTFTADAGGPATSRWTLRFSVVGSTLQAKAWQSVLAEPNAFTLTATDSTFANAGNVGFRSVRGAGNTNGGISTFAANFRVGNIFTDSIHALYFAPQRFGESWSVERVTINNTSQGQVPTVYVMRGLVRPDTAFNFASITYPHQPPLLLATSNVVDSTPNGTNDVDDLTSPINLSSGEYFSVLFAAAQYPPFGTTQTSTVFVGGQTNR